MSDTEQCARCGRVTEIESAEFTEWEALDDGTRAICPGCLTAEEQQQIDEDDYETGVLAPLDFAPAWPAGTGRGRPTSGSVRRDKKGTGRAAVGRLTFGWSRTTRLQLSMASARC